MRSPTNQLKQWFQNFNISRTFFSRSIFQKKTWLLFVDRLIWQVLPTRRQISKLIDQLTPLRVDVPANRKFFRDRVFALTCLKLKKLDRQHLLELLNCACEPTGLEQAFLTAIFPKIIERGFSSIPIHTSNQAQLHVEIGYLAHNEDYFFWVLEIDGERKDNPDRPTIVPTLEIRGAKKFVKYPLGVVGLVNGLNTDSVPIGSLDTLGWIINSQIHFNRVLKDLKKRNYEVTTTEQQNFELGRLKLLRRLGLRELKKH